MTSTLFHRIAGLFGLLALTGAISAQAAIPASQRQYLLDFYTATGGANWTNQANWGGAAGTECTWFGVTCDLNATTVIELKFSSNHLVSSVGVPVPDWSALPDLQVISLDENQLAGPVPAISSLAQLVHFFIGRNQFTGALPAPAGLQHLERYFAYQNQFSGSIPALDNLPALTVFTVRNNQLTGSIPPLGGAPNLEQLGLGYNQLAGGIPVLPAGLTRLYVNNNQLTGPVPAAPNSLLTNDSQLCPNYLTPSASNDWDVATGETPWHAQCSAAPLGLGGVAGVPALDGWALALLATSAAVLGLGTLRRRRA